MCECLKGLDEWTTDDCKAWFLVHLPESPYSTNGALGRMSAEEARYLVRIHAGGAKCPREHRVSLREEESEQCRRGRSASGRF